jgi:hypothetical protein
MSLTISTVARCALPLVVALAAPAVPANAEGGTFVQMRAVLRACDYSPIPDFASTNNGTASAVVHASGGAVTADVHFAEPSEPGTHFDVELIQVPRPANAPCDGPGPGVAVGALDTDGAGVGNATVRGGLSSGTTGVWVFIRRPSPRSQSPAEFYTSDFTVKV